MTLGGGPLHVDRVELFSLTEIDPMVQIDRPSARTVLDSVELIDGERYDQLYLEGETPDGERVRVCLGGGHGGRVEFFVISEGLGETHYLVRPGVEPLDALTTVSTGGQETEVLERWLPERSRAHTALAHYLDTSELDPGQEWDLFEPQAFQALLARK